MDAFRALSLLAPKKGPDPKLDIRELPPEEPLAPDMESMLGLVRTGTAAPLDSRSRRLPLPFEDLAIREIVIDALEKGYPVKVVLHSVGFSAGQWRMWEMKGARGIEPYATFHHLVTTAKARGALVLLDQVRAAGEGAPDQHGIWKNQWQASKWLLERQDPDTFMPVEKSISAHIELQPTQQVDVRAMSDEDLLALVDVLDRAPVIDVGGEEELPGTPGHEG